MGGNKLVSTSLRSRDFLTNYQVWSQRSMLSHCSLCVLHAVAQHLRPHGPHSGQNPDEYHVALIVDDLSNTRWLQIQGNILESLRLTDQSRIVRQSYGYFDCWYATTGPDVIAIDTYSGRVTRTFPLEQFADLQAMVRKRRGGSLAGYGREALLQSKRERQRRSMPMRERLRRDRGSWPFGDLSAEIDGLIRLLHVHAPIGRCRRTGAGPAHSVKRNKAKPCEGIGFPRYA